MTPHVGGGKARFGSPLAAPVDQSNQPGINGLRRQSIGHRCGQS
jgi:hypothetical protein